MFFSYKHSWNSLALKNWKMPSLPQFKQNGIFTLIWRAQLALMYIPKKKALPHRSPRHYLRSIYAHILPSSSNFLTLKILVLDRRDQGDRQRRKMTAPGDATSLIVQNLRPGTRYKFRVAAENRHGISPESQAVTTRMLEEGWLCGFSWHEKVFWDFCFLL